MRLLGTLVVLMNAVTLSACIHKGSNPADPLENLNRKTHDFNVAFDATFLKPPARFYKTVIPGKVRVGVNNFYQNINMIPTVGNDLLQTEWGYALKDSWRFIINSTIGFAGILDVAANCGLPPRSNDLGITFAKWGYKNSAYIVVPFIGPSTIRDAVGTTVEYAVLTPYPYINNQAVLYSLLGLRYIDLRSQLFETEELMDQALDKYAFIRDAWLQNRNYKIQGEKEGADTLYVEESDGIGNDYIEE
jgi:phospholipid-binding lipoprotein MlaA